MRRFPYCFGGEGRNDWLHIRFPLTAELEVGLVWPLYRQVVREMMDPCYALAVGGFLAGLEQRTCALVHLLLVLIWVRGCPSILAYKGA